MNTYLSAGDVQLNLTPISAHQSLKLLANTLKDTQSVVLSKGREEVAQKLVLASKLLQFLDNLRLVLCSQGGSVQDRTQLGVLLEHLGQSIESLGGLL